MQFEKGRLIKDRYLIIRKIGSGGMAEVYLAEDVVLNRKVAIKVMHENLASDENFVRRFRREAQAAANLNHPNIVSVFDWGREEGTYFIVMEYIIGKTLKEIIREKGSLPLDFGLDIAKQIASALAFAHRHEVIHRDIKPHNIIITEEGLVKVTDFGIARAKSGSITDTGPIMGSVQYISPEQAQGLPATELSDIYSFGVVMYEMFTGNLPFEGDSAISIAMKHASEIPVPPSKLNPEIPIELEKIILKSMAKDPYERYQTADELLQDLKMFTSGKPVEAARPSYEKTVVIKQKTQSGKEKRKGFGSVILAMLILLLIAAVAFGAYSYLSQQAKRFVAVPKLVDLSVKEAEKLLSEKGLKIDIASKKYSATYEKDKIISQDPPPGTRIEKGKVVKVVVSLGERPVKVPNLFGKSVLEAGQILGELGLRIGEVTYEYSDNIPEDMIMKQSPSPNSEVSKGTAVDIVISKGVEVVIIPDVTGLSLDKAKEMIKKAGLKFEVVEEESETFEKGKVIRQSPSPGDNAKKGDKVLLVVSSGPAFVAVPNLIGMDSLSARNQLQSLGLEVETVNVEVFEESQVGKVVQQTPDPNTKVRKGTKVTIWIGI
ncbi:MAG: PASTA domain-containing protein [Actinobacteria bacterium]|nr:PASTA domain-containing protein [Actinomycetota bacterium]